VPQHHLERSGSERFCRRTRVHFGHHKSTGKSMSVAMSRIISDLGLFENRREPPRNPGKAVPVRMEGTTQRLRGSFSLLFRTSLFQMRFLLREKAFACCAASLPKDRDSAVSATARSLPHETLVQ
jgi:hypothetical protein